MSTEESIAYWLPDSPSKELWDAVIVGTGIGGSTAGLALARAGLKVLFVEKGRFRQTAPDSPATETGSGWWPHRVRAETNLGNLEFNPPIGCITGGSSAFYAAGLERFAPADFSPRANFPNATDSSLPEHWPIEYAELEPWYERAEELYRVRGTQDPLFNGGPSQLRSPPEPSERDSHFEQSFSSIGLHPYRVHVGCEFLPGCDGCPSHPCRKNCKKDAASTCLLPALNKHGARLLPECEAIRFEASQNEIQALVCRSKAGEFRLHARRFILAAGAFMSPVLLLRSRSATWPDGLANRSGLVGRNLMFHAGDFFAISPTKSVSGQGPQKTLALNDFYHTDGDKLGTFQTLGTGLELGQIMQYLRDTAESSTAWWRWVFSQRPFWWRKLSSPVVRAVATVFYHLFRFRYAGVWASILEDLPYHRNRVWPDPDNEHNICIRYDYSQELQSRVKLFRKKLRESLGRHRIMVLTPVKKIDYAHVCGTCRFGDDPTTSVLDRNNRAHDVGNLYVVDASFFPSSGGTNPSLTIAANALRVADSIIEQHAKGEKQQ